jgi:hypothetical protein
VPNYLTAGFDGGERQPVAQLGNLSGGMVRQSVDRYCLYTVRNSPGYGPAEWLTSIVGSTSVRCRRYSGLLILVSIYLAYGAIS